MKKTIALVYGGDSSEHEISIKSGKNIAGHIDRSRYEVWEVIIRGSDWRVVGESDEQCYQIEKGDFSFIIKDEGEESRRVKFDKVLIMIHGTPGEDGLLQAYFEMIGMPFTSCSAEVSLLTFNKYACKCFLRDSGINLAKEIFLRKGDSYCANEIVSKLGLPLFVKPNNGGSSFGVTKVKRVEELEPAIINAFKEDSSILIEEFIEGREMTNGVFENGIITQLERESLNENASLAKSGLSTELFRLPVTEIISDNEFFDYQAKYLGASKEICPAEITPSLSNKIVDISHKIYRRLGCKGIVRVDYIVRGNEVFFLEVNTVPGMTQMSLVPQQLKTAGISLIEFITHLIEA